MRLELRMIYLETIYQRYRKASKESKGKILDELCNVCMYNQKYAIWKIGQLRNKPKAPIKKRRPKKYDNAHIEQKNWTHVQKFMGWDRYDSQEALEAMNDLYENELSLFMNLFQPSVKLRKTVRTGSRKKRIYDAPQTPLDRLLASKQLDEKTLTELKRLRERLDPFSLSERINKKLEYIWDLAHYRYKPSDIKEKTHAELDELSSFERETLEALSHTFGITVYVRTHKRRRAYRCWPRLDFK